MIAHWLPNSTLFHSVSLHEAASELKCHPDGRLIQPDNVLLCQCFQQALPQRVEDEDGEYLGDYAEGQYEHATDGPA